MKILKKIALLSALITPLLPGVYAVPAEFDNFRLGHLSTTYGIITGTTPGTSANLYTLGGQTVRYRCLVVPKIQCVASTATIVPTLSEVSVRHNTTGEVLSLWSADIRIEDGGTQWFVCGAAYAGERSDDSTLTKVDNADGSVSLQYTYEPNINHYDVIAFATTIPGGFNSAATSSYMTVQHRQICR